MLQVNLKTSSKRYHWNAIQKTRDAKAKRWTRDFVAYEQADRNDRQLYATMPSPKGSNWTDYVQHRLKMLEFGVATYSSEKYTGLRFNKYIHSVRASDEKAGELVGYQSAIVFFGASETPPNCPIRIKKHVRAPGGRKLLASFKKRANVVVVPTNEDFTSQTCARCYGRFRKSTRSHRFKVCQNCQPNHSALLPTMVATMKSRRLYRIDRLHYHFLEQQSMENAAQPDQPAESLLSKVRTHHYEWRVNPATGVMENATIDQLNGNSSNQEKYVTDASQQYPWIRKTVWNRDIVAAKCILIKGVYYY